MKPKPVPPCTLCGGLRDCETARQKYGWEENDTFLPGAVNDLLVVHDLKPGSSRRQEVRQCPACGGYFLYESDYEYLVNGSEDEETLRRLTPEEAGKYLVMKKEGGASLAGGCIHEPESPASPK